jgi:hypothetical protein
MCELQYITLGWQLVLHLISETVHVNVYLMLENSLVQELSDVNTDQQ